MPPNMVINIQNKEKEEHKKNNNNENNMRVILFNEEIITSVCVLSYYLIKLSDSKVED